MNVNDNYRPATVLVVEDEFLIRANLADYLHERGFNVLEAGTADDAVEIIAHAETPIDAVFSDVMMPGKLNGIGLAQWLQVEHPEVPILLTSGRADCIADAVRRCGRALAKPYDLDHVVREIRNLM